MGFCWLCVSVFSDLVAYIFGVLRGHGLKPRGIILGFTVRGLDVRV